MNTEAHEESDSLAQLPMVQTTWFALRSFFVSQWSVRSPNTHCIASDIRASGSLSRAHILGRFFFAYRLAICAGQGRSRYGSLTWISTIISFSPVFTNRSPMSPRINYDPLGFGQVSNYVRRVLHHSLSHQIFSFLPLQSPSNLFMQCAFSLGSGELI